MSEASDATTHRAGEPVDGPPRVRRATTADIDLVAPLFDAYRVFYGKAPDLAAARAFLAARLAREESVVLLASIASADGEETIGFAQLYRSFSSVSLGAIVILNDLFVAPTARRSGAARRLIAGAVALAEREGAIRLDLATQHANAPALALYRSLGFVAETGFTHMSLTLGGATGAGDGDAA